MPGWRDCVEDGSGEFRVLFRKVNVSSLRHMRIAITSRLPEWFKRLLRWSVYGSWFRLRLATAGWRVLPDFVILGAQKAGTSSLNAYLSDHPCVLPAWGKELLYFTHHYTKGLRWYRAMFPLRLTMAMKARLRGARCVTGEASPYYLFHPAVPERMHADLPNAKLIVLLRDPVDRAISQYYHARKWGYEDLPIEEAFAAEEERVAGEEERLMQVPDYVSIPWQELAYGRRSLYLDQIKAWRARFPREQMLVLKAEHLFTQSEETFREVLDFLGLPPWEPKEFARHNPGRYTGKNAAFREKLCEFFEPHNQRLYEYLGVSWRWEA